MRNRWTLSSSARARELSRLRWEGRRIYQGVPWAQQTPEQRREYQRIAQRKHFKKPGVARRHAAYKRSSRRHAAYKRSYRINKLLQAWALLPPGVES